MQRFILATLSTLTLGVTLASGANALKPLNLGCDRSNSKYPAL
jgi:hypothetical protein